MKTANGSKNTFTNPVGAIESPKELERLRLILADRPRDLLLVDLITGTTIPIRDLLRLKVKDLLHLKVGDLLPVGGSKAKRRYESSMTNVLNDTWLKYVNEVRPHEDDYIFKSRKGNKPLTLQGVSQMIKRRFDDAGLRGLNGIRSLRKAWVQHAFPDKGRLHQELKDEAGVEVLKPIEIAGIAETVYRELLRAIVSGKIMPGQKLTAETIATQMKVSSMPVREALGRLKEAGFVSVSRKTGVVVKALSREMLRDILEIRLALEGLAARKAAVAVSEETLHRLEWLHREYERANRLQNADEMLRINKQFHLTIYREAGMPLLEDLIEGLWNKISPYFHILLRILDEGEHSLSQETANNHKHMLEGMRHRDPKEVWKWLEPDLTVPTEQVIAYFERIIQAGSTATDTSVQVRQ
jgi:DNA-binding GntR family transcriptional regulator